MRACVNGTSWNAAYGILELGDGFVGKGKLGIYIEIYRNSEI